jgi:hypothetical protein
MPLGDVNIPLASAATFKILDVPSVIGVDPVVRVDVRCVNVSDMALTVEACRDANGDWCATFPSSFFIRDGRIENGLQIEVWTATEKYIAGVGSIAVGKYGAQVSRIGDGVAYSVKGDDIYVKTKIVDGVWHYAKQEVVWDDDMSAYGAKWIGDFIIDANGNFVEVENV